MIIETQDNQTIQKMYKAIEDNHTDEERDYLGASMIGDPCARKIWYNYNKYPRDPFKAKTLMTFESGHRSEDLAAERLRLIPDIELITHKEDGSQYGFSDFEEKFKGHCDGAIRGLVEAPKTWHVWEHKETNEKKFAEFNRIKAKVGEKEALKEWNEVYYAQAQIYMHYFKMNRHYTTVSTMGGRDYSSCRTNYNASYAKDLVRKAQMIIEAKSVPQRISNRADFYMCRWCDYKEKCHG